MCGIAGIDGIAGESIARAQSMCSALQTRGPDGSWVVSRGQYTLVQTRLAIIDTSDRVVYPMPNEDRTLWLLFNGEIYNHRELRGELERRGHRFRTSCDAEVIVHGFEEWDCELFPRLNGMFALALLDNRRGGELVLARDSFGIKPLVRTTGRRFAFASDAMALVRCGVSEGIIDEEAIRQYAVLHYVPEPRTGLVDVRHVQPGTALRRDARGQERVLRWSQGPLPSPAPAADFAVDRVEVALSGAVRRHLAADVRVGILLSSGIDSSLLLSMAIEAGARPTAFTIGFAGFSDYDEQQAARRFARACGVEHVLENLDTTFAHAIDDVRDAFDQPFADSSAIATLALARLARSSVTVALSGTGGDDLFAGYYRHRAHLLLKLLRWFPEGALSMVRGPSQRGGERASAFRLGRSYVRRLAAATRTTPAHQYAAILAPQPPDGYLRALMLDVEPLEVVAEFAEVRGLFEPPHASPLRTIQRFDMATYLLGDLLAKEDRASMATGLETRVPMLDDETVRAADACPDAWKISLRTGKRVLREIGRRRLPGDLARRRKRGFAVPLRQLLAGPWADEAREWFADSQSSYVDGREASELVAAETGGADVWALGALAAWEQRLQRERTTCQRTVLSRPPGHLTSDARGERGAGPAGFST